ncbi:hydroxylamine reductase, partial [bacterium]|nr:hydroxylamine reductase [bacterium]
MFCYQCQETAKNTGCTIKGVCGKNENTSNLQDLLIYVLKGISIWAEKSNELPINYEKDTGRFIAQSLFTTITNVSFDDPRIIAMIEEGLERKEKIKEKYLSEYKNKNGIEFTEEVDESAVWYSKDKKEYETKAAAIGILTIENEDVRSLRGLLIYGLKGISAYLDHAAVLGHFNEDIDKFLIEGLSSTTKDLTAEQMTEMVLKAGKYAVDAMALLDKANTSAYGNPEITEVNIGVRSNPGILISGHDLKDMEELLEQTEGTGIDVYTHGEMLPANSYPAFKKYKHFVGNYGNSWWKQNKEFESFNGPILMTTNCITPVKESYKDSIFTTGLVGYPGVKHIPERKGGKDFSEIINLARKCPPPKEIETGSIIGGFAHNQVLALADKIIDA